MADGQRVALVTGGSRGIGRAICLALAQDGFDVAINYRSDGMAAAEVQRAIEQTGQSAVHVQADVAESSQVQNMVNAVLDRFGRVDVLVTNAGHSEDVSILDLTEEAWDRSIAVNLKGAFNCVKALVRHFTDRRSGRIITISSNAGREGALLVGVHYSAAKTGVIGLTRGLARQLAPYNVTVNCVAPGGTRTDAQKRRTPEQLSERIRAIPLGRLGLPEETAAAVAFLASDRASFITGAVIDVNGGQFMG